MKYLKTFENFKQDSDNKPIKESNDELIFVPDTPEMGK